MMRHPFFDAILAHSHAISDGFMGGFADKLHGMAWRSESLPHHITQIQAI